jgi:hypothetical protein
MSGESSRTVPMSGQFAAATAGGGAGAGFLDDEMDVDVGGGGLQMDDEGGDEDEGM